MTPLTLASLSVAAAVVALTSIPFVLRWADRRRIVAVPNARSSHTRVTPVGGGLPITFCVILMVVAGGAWSERAFESWWLSVALGASAVAAISWVDDMRSVGMGPRLAVHVVAAGLVVAASGVGGPGPWGALAWVVAAVWIVGVTNAYNFMDGVDGIAGAQAVVAGTGWAILGLMTSHPLAAAVGAVIAGASAGFLRYNWHPAVIFMGDVGAAVIGFTLAALSAVTWSGGWREPLAGGLLLWPFLFDSAFTLGRRLVRGENVFRAHRSHLYQRLSAAGWSHDHVAATYAALSAAGFLAAVLVLRGSRPISIAAGIAPGLLAFGLWLCTVRAEARARARRA